MVRCPKCNRTYENESQKFCTRDGGRLIPVESAGFDANSTVVSPQPKAFDPNATVVSQPTPPSSPKPQPTPPQQAFDPNATVIATPPPSPQPAPPSASPSFDPNATVYSPPPSQTIPPSQTPSQPRDPQLFQTIASPTPNIQPTPPVKSPYDSTEDLGPSSYPSVSSQPPSYTPSVPPPSPQTPQIPMPARYDAGAPTSTDFQMPSQSSRASDDLGYATIVGVPDGTQSYNPVPPTSTELHMPEEAEAMHTQMLSQSGTYNTGNYNTAGQVAAPAQPKQNVVAPPPKKKSKAFLFLGLGAIFLALFLVVATAGIVLFLKPELIGMGGNTTSGNTNNVNNSNGSTNQTQNNNQTGQTNSNNSNSRNTNENNNTGANETPPPPNSTQFVNTEANASGDLANHFAPFSFYYPQTWTKSPAPKGYFVELIRKLPDGFPQEHFAASYYNSKGTLDADRVDFEKKVQESSAELAKSFPGYKKISEGETKINGVAGYEFKFSGQINDATKGLVNFYGRMVFLPPGKDSDKNGIKLLMYGTSLAPELQNMEDFSVKGELPVILKSFKLGQ